VSPALTSNDERLPALPEETVAGVVADEPVIDLPLGRQGVADVQAPRLAAALPLRTVELQAEQVQAEEQRDVEELVEPVRPRPGVGQEVLAAVELHLPARRQLAAEALAVELRRQLERNVADGEAGPGIRQGDQVETRVQDVADGHLARAEESEELAVGIFPAEAEAQVRDPVIGGQDVSARLHEKEISGGIGGGLQAVLAAPLRVGLPGEAEGLVDERSVEEPVRELELRIGRRGQALARV
jgi:hypothetical protein